nr:hypothetical protein [uncultured Mucilaginibacter sp.]
MNKYSLFFCKVVAITIPIFVFYSFLYCLGYTPFITNSISFDAKLKFIKEKKIRQADLIAIGSSMTLNNLSSETIKDSLTTSYFNFASWGLQMKDINQLVVNYISKYKPQYILVVSSITDFRNDELSTTIQNYLNTDQYIRDNFEGYFYIKNFNSIASIRSREKERCRSSLITANDYTSLNFDEYGGVLLNISKQNISLNRWNDHSPFPTKSTPGHYRALMSLSAYLKMEHIKFIFVQAPIKQQYVNTLASQQAVYNHITKCKNIIEKDSGIYLNFNGVVPFMSDSLFVDQFHLSSAGATIFTKKLTHSLRTMPQADAAIN